MAAGDKVWVVGQDTAYQVDPANGATVKSLRFPAVDGALNRTIPGTWISAIAVRNDKVYVTRNSAPVVQVADITSGQQATISIPDGYAGAQALGVDPQGWIYLGLAEGSATKTAIVKPDGTLAGELNETTMRISSGNDGVEMIPGPNRSCDSYIQGKIVHSYPLGNRQPTACQLAGDNSVVGWNVEGGGYSISKDSSVVDFEPTTVSTSIVNPMGNTVPATISDSPRAVCLTLDGTVWTLSRNGSQLSIRS